MGSESLSYLPVKGGQAGEPSIVSGLVEFFLRMGSRSSRSDDI
jgi:hypothetical protein